MQVAARLYATLFEVFFPMSKVEDYAWHRNFLSGQRTFWAESQEFLCRYALVWSVNKDACVNLCW